MSLTERFRWLLRMTMMLFVLASIAFLSALTAMRYAIQGREVTLPGVIGKRAADAQQILQAQGIGMKIEDRIYSTLPVDEVVRQSPPPNMTVKAGQLAHVVLSLGPRKQTIPQLENRSVRSARIELLQTGMQVGEISSAYLSGTPEDMVLLQDPAPGSTNITSPHVNFLASLGSRPAAYVMPDLVGLPVNEAVLKLNHSGLRIAKITPSPALGIPSGSVVSQTPARGHRVEPDATIELQIAQ
jgi:beta-lactam-binding protein with PASTA domain